MSKTRTILGSLLSAAALLAVVLVAAPPALGREIRFAPGTIGTTINGAVIRGERAVYTLKAARGQRMRLRIRSVENNAVFALYRPNGATLATEATAWDGVLPASGRYTIEVGGTRGNATYTLAVEIR